MAEYKLVNTEQLDTDILGIATALRNKLGTTEKLAFPNGLIDAITSMAAGGGGGGGLPVTVQAIDSGIYTAASNVAGEYQIPHSLGVAPDFYILWLQDLQSIPQGTQRKQVYYYIKAKEYNNGGCYFSIGFEHSVDIPGYYIPVFSQDDNLGKYATAEYITLKKGPIENAYGVQSPVGPYVWICGKVVKGWV